MVTVKLKILLPAGVLLEAETEKIVATSVHGSFCLLPHHIDYVATLVPGLFSYVPAGGGGAELLALDAGTLLKRGAEVLVSVRNAVQGAPGQLHLAIRTQFETLDEQERGTRAASTQLETDLVRRLMAFKEPGMELR